MKRHEEIVFSRDIADMDALQDFSGHRLTIKDLAQNRRESAAPQSPKKDRVSNLLHFLFFNRAQHASSTLPQTDASRRCLLGKLLCQNSRHGADESKGSADGKSSISVGDYAKALADELIEPAHHQERFTIVYQVFQ